MTRKARLTLIACIFTFAIVLCAMVLVLYWQENEDSEREYEALASDAIRLVTPAFTTVPATQAATLESATPPPSSASENTLSPSPVPTFTPKPTATPYAPEEAGTHLEVDFNTLHKASSDIIAWLYLPGTSLSYPVAAANSERDEGYYLTHSYQGSSSSAGTLFIESWADKNFTDKNTLIHGHRMNSGAMFGNLYQYARQSYYEKHPTMELYTPEGNWRIHIFASFEAELGDFYAQTEFDSTADFLVYIDKCIEASDIDTAITPQKGDKILSLVTCVLGDDTARRVVQGVLEKMD